MHVLPTGAGVNVIYIHTYKGCTGCVYNTCVFCTHTHIQRIQNMCVQYMCVLYTYAYKGCTGCVYNTCVFCTVYTYTNTRFDSMSVQHMCVLHTYMQTY